ncbi:S1 family peptidase [Streptomyces sodiiphilus]|uniref:S1 family peptidase n=1 Tax=Streptomyces sodiiphilus TaxID=226217 RepID=A0ABP5A1I7_9ACTN
MTHRRTINRRVLIAATGVAALMAGTFAAAQASANPTPTNAPATLSSEAAGELATTLAEDMKVDQESMYYDAETQRLVVNVADEIMAAGVEASGVEIRQVDHSLAELNEVKAGLEDVAIPGTAWAIDPVTNKVQVSVDSTVTGDDLAAVEAKVAEFGDMASLENDPGTFEAFIAGGDAIYSSGARCSLGFNVTAGNGARAFLTAGHCGNVGSNWSATSGGASIGQMTRSTFPGQDNALVMATGAASHPSAVNLYNGSQQQITGAGNATVGQSVQRSGSTTGRHSGSVTALNATVNYAQGSVTGMIRTSVCAEPGDSGGALFAGSTALGLTSGGSGNCSSGGTTFFEPVTRALSATGARLP